MVGFVRVVRVVDSCRIDSDVYALYEVARLNRVGFYFLYRLVDCGYSLRGTLRHGFDAEYERYRGIMGEFVRLTEVLRSCGVGFAIFKSLKPYPTTTVDIDVVIFDDYWQAVRCLLNRGYRVLGYGSESITFDSPSGWVKVDLYRRIAVSRLVYLDRNALRDYVCDVETEFGVVRNLSLEADLVAFAAHAVVKEQMVTLSEYFTFREYTSKVDLDKVFSIARKLRVEEAFRLILSIVDIVHWLVYGEKIFNISVDDVISYEVSRFLRKPEMPFKISISALAYILFRKFREDRVFRRSIYNQIIYLLWPWNAKSFMRELFSHVVRKTY